MGLNYYPTNQWIHGGPPIVRGPSAAPAAVGPALRGVCAASAGRLLIAETGTEGDGPGGLAARWSPPRCARARDRGVPVEGICLYPVANHLGWDDDRLCENGLLGHEVSGGTRAVHTPLQRQVADENLRFMGLARTRAV